MKTNPTQCFTKKNEFGFALFGGFQSRRTQSPLVLSAVMLTVLVLAFIFGAAMGQAREKTQTGGVVMSYRYEDGSLQKLLEERPELLG